MLVPCGRCVACLANKQNDWAVRLLAELQDSLYAHFLTLTYTDHDLPRSEEGHSTLCRRDVQLFMKRLRKRCSTLGINNIRYFFTGSMAHKLFALIITLLYII